MVSVLFLLPISCKMKKEQVQDAKTASKPAEKRVMPDTLPPPSQEDLEKQQASYNLIEELEAYLSSQKDLSKFAALVGRMKGKHLFANSGKQGYRILAITDAGFMKMPERVRLMLTDDSGMHLGYQMKFFIHHASPQPIKPFAGYAFTAMSGQSLRFSRDSVSMPDLKRTSAFKIAGMAGSKLHVFRLDEALFY
ncbi:MAG: hypothetical protein IPM34_11285 [Saprospiraceae bacterium]|nr:hypothetical protein [Saprospiraceae bacterium]